MISTKLPGIAALIAVAILLFDARNSIRLGEFRFGGRLRSTPPVYRREHPKLFWALVGSYVALGILALVLAVAFLF